MKCIDASHLTEILLQDFSPSNSFSTWLPTWEQLLEYNRWELTEEFFSSLFLGDLDGSILQHSERCLSVLGYRFEADIYLHKPVVIENCVFSLCESHEQLQGYVAGVKIPNNFGSTAYKVRGLGKCIELEKKYVLISLHPNLPWIAGTIRGKRIMNRRTILQISKVGMAYIPDTTLVFRKDVMAGPYYSFNVKAEKKRRLVTYV